MPIDTDQIRFLLGTLEAAGKELTDSYPLSERQRYEIIQSAEKLAIAAREPEENVYYIATQIAQNAAIRCAIAIHVFEGIPSDGTSISAETLARKLQVNKQLLVRILRACTSTHILLETCEERYTHNNLSRAYLRSENRDMMAQMYDFTCKGVFALPEYGIKTEWQSNGNYSDGPFQLGARTELGFWEYLNDIPERMQLFNSGMRSQTTVGNGRLSGAYPFGEELNKKPIHDNEVLIVDVGGGRGQSLEAIKQDYPHIKGRLILQDLPDVIDDAKLNGLPPFIETDVASFFEPQHIQGARAYYFRRIFHDWDQRKAQEILTNTRVAMTAQSRIIIADMVLPNTQAPRDIALQDLNMMSFGGMERTERQWGELIEASGLVIRKIWRANGAKHGVIEAALPTTASQDHLS